ncbi:hypothetical protein [Rhodococcus qingshengii]|uniref:hypothetical protein n=1 Tax=Rhodococcus qingshengii TaxID=334542 RepID=UPI0035E2C2EE
MIVVWQADEFGIQDAWGVGGDLQVGGAWEIRFTNPDLPRCLVQVSVFVDAPELPYDEQPECTHVDEPVGWKCRNSWDDFHKPGGGFWCACWIPEEHLSCTYDMDSLGLSSLTEFVIMREGITGDESPFDNPDWEWRSAYVSLDTRPFNRDRKAANRAAHQWLKNFDPNRDISWDGKPF